MRAGGHGAPMIWRRLPPIDADWQDPACIEADDAFLGAYFYVMMIYMLPGLFYFKTYFAKVRFHFERDTAQKVFDTL